MAEASGENPGRVVLQPAAASARRETTAPVAAQRAAFLGTRSWLRTGTDMASIRLPDGPLQRAAIKR
jgi:hypothetical protein